MSEAFPSTLWTEIGNAARRNPAAAARFSHRYRTPIVGFVRSQGFSPHDAEDLAQEVFVRLFSEEILGRADRARGRFRTLLICVTKQVVVDWLRRDSALKRGGGATRLALEGAEEPFEVVAARHAEEPAFDSHWIFNLTMAALEELRLECDRTGRPYHGVLQMYSGGMTYEQIAEKLATNLNNIRSWIHRGRDRLAELVKAQIRAYSSSSAEYEDEIRHLLRLVSL
jgi:RNA polymerase sigma factor (sigma-70 family)